MDVIVKRASANETVSKPKFDAEYITPVQVTEVVPGLTVQLLARLRFTGDGPAYRKPTPRTVLYKRSEVLAWVEASARRGTAPDAA